jgi:hypothetical protein
MASDKHVNAKCDLIAKCVATILKNIPPGYGFEKLVHKEGDIYEAHFIPLHRFTERRGDNGLG